MKKLMLLCSLVVLFFGTTAFVKVKEANNLKAFAKFLMHFDKVEMPFEIDFGDFEKYKELKMERDQSKEARSQYRNNLSTYGAFIPEVRSRKMSRLGPSEIIPVGRFYPNDKMVAVIYARYHPFMENHAGFVLKLFDLKGQPIKTDKKNTLTYGSNSLQLGSSSFTDLETFSIGNDGLITQQRYITLWEKDLDQHGIEDNEIIGYELENTSYVQLMADGDFKQLKHVASMAGSQP